MSAIDIERGRCCCFTGHRPDKLNTPEYELRALLKGEIEAAIADGYDVFISGMARGVDIIAAEEVLAAARTNPGIQLICAYPYPNSTAAFARKWRLRAAETDKHAMLRVDVCAGYYKGCFMRRNEWMIEHSARLIAVFNGTHGGTHATILRAMRRDLDIHAIMIE